MALKTSLAEPLLESKDDSTLRSLQNMEVFSNTNYDKSSAFYDSVDRFQGLDELKLSEFGNSEEFSSTIPVVDWYANADDLGTREEQLYSMGFAGTAESYTEEDGIKFIDMGANNRNNCEGTNDGIPRFHQTEESELEISRPQTSMGLTRIAENYNEENGVIFTDMGSKSNIRSERLKVSRLDDTESSTPYEQTLRPQTAAPEMLVTSQPLSIAQTVVNSGDLTDTKGFTHIAGSKQTLRPKTATTEILVASRPLTAAPELYNCGFKNQGKSDEFSSLKNLISMQSKQIVDLQKRSELRAQKLSNSTEKCSRLESQVIELQNEISRLKSKVSDEVENIRVKERTDKVDKANEQMRTIQKLQEKVKRTNNDLVQALTSSKNVNKLKSENKSLNLKLLRYKDSICKMVKIHDTDKNISIEDAMKTLQQELQSSKKNSLQYKKEYIHWKQKYESLVSASKKEKSNLVLVKKKNRTKLKDKPENNSKVSRLSRRSDSQSLPIWKPAWRNNNNSIDSNTGVFLLRPHTVGSTRPIRAQNNVKAKVQTQLKTVKKQRKIKRRVR